MQRPRDLLCLRRERSRPNQPSPSRSTRRLRPQRDRGDGRRNGRNRTDDPRENPVDAPRKDSVPSRKRPRFCSRLLGTGIKPIPNHLRPRIVFRAYGQSPWPIQFARIPRCNRCCRLRTQQFQSIGNHRSPRSIPTRASNRCVLRCGRSPRRRHDSPR